MKLSKKKLQELNEIIKDETPAIKRAVSELNNTSLKGSYYKVKEAKKILEQVIGTQGSKELPIKLLSIYKGATIRGELIALIKDTEFLKGMYRKGLPQTEVTSIAKALKDDTAFIERILIENTFATCYPLIQASQSVQVLELLLQYATGYYKSSIRKRLRNMPKSVKFMEKVGGEEIDRYQPDPEMAKKVTEALKQKLGDKDYLKDFENFLKRVNLTNKDKETLKILVGDLKEL